MATICHPLVRGTRIRVTRLDECGEPVEGECSQVVSKGFISVGMSDDVEAPTVNNPTNADGDYCYYDQTKPQLNFVNAEIQLCEVDPDLFEMMTGSPLVLDANGDTSGFDTDHETYASAFFALELWSRVPATNSAACPPGGQRWGYFLMPFLARGSFGDLTVENAGVNFTVSATSNRGTPWGTGPYDVELDALGAAGPMITPVAPSTPRRFMFTQVAPPEPLCGCQPLVIESP